MFSTPTGGQSNPAYGGYLSRPLYPQLPAGQQSQPQQQQQQQLTYNPYQSQHVQSYGQQHPNQVAQHAGVVQAPAPFGNGPIGGSSWGARGSYGFPTAPSQLQPQQFETVAKDEDAVYGPLGRARGKIDRAIVSDNEISPDLADLLAHHLTPDQAYVPRPSPNAAFRNARVTRSTPLPDALHQELTYKHMTARMGLFEEIERAWFTVDNRLFLWDYSDGREFSRYDQQADTIQAVGLVRARNDVFVDTITHLLVICTATKVTLLGLSRSEKGELSLYATGMSVDSPTGMAEIRGTDAGRVFMLGVNKDLYELEYSTSGGWLGGGNKVWITNRLSGYLSTWVPTVFQSGTKEGIESFVLDAQAGRLFALHSRGEVEWFDVSGAKFDSRARYNTLRNDFGRPTLGAQSPSDPLARVVSIAAVGKDESKRAWLVAISASGARIYLGAAAYYGGSSLGVVGSRPPPPETTKLLPQSFYSSGTFIAVQDEAGPSPTSRLTFVTPAIGRQSALRENNDTFTAPTLQEWVTIDKIPSQVWTIAEVAATNPKSAGPALRRDDQVSLTEFAREAVVGARQFLILCTSGIFFAEQPRPIDMLESDLEVEKEQAIAVARESFGRVQLSGIGILMGATAEKLQVADLVSASVNIMLTADGPFVRQGQSGLRSIVYSPRHDGLALTLARFLRPIWNAKVVIAAPPPARFKLGVPDKTLLNIQEHLAELHRYLEDHPFPRYQAEGDAKLAWEQEELSLHGLNVLLKQAVEAISFILLLSDYKLPDVIAKCEPAVQSTLTSLTFQGLLTSLGGRDVARKLVTALIELQIGQELGIDNLSAILQQRCGTFVQPGDVVLYKAEECLRRAESTRDATERQESISESLRLFSRAAGSAATAVLARLPDSSRRYRALQDVRGTIELPLRVASELDPDDKAGDYVRDGRIPGDPRIGFLEQRQECYQLVVEALGGADEELNKAVANGTPNNAVRNRDEAYGLALQSDDELFHFYLYDWISVLDRADQLLDMETPFIERYLQQTTSNVRGRRDLLWKYYARREEYLLAAKALSDLAMRPGDMTLEERVYYLAQALTNAKSGVSVGSEDVEFTTGLQEHMDVAQVQLEVVHAVQSHPEMSPVEKVEPLEQLNGELLTLDDLYLHFARPLRLFEAILLILKTSDTRVEDVTHAVWEQLLNTRATASSDAAAELVTTLCRKFYPSEGAPMDIVVPLVYTWAAERSDAETAPAGWVTRALMAGGVGVRETWDVSTALHDEAGEPAAREFYAEQAAAAVRSWLETGEGLPAAEVENFASHYALSAGEGGVNARRAETKKTMLAAKAAAGRF